MSEKDDIKSSPPGSILIAILFVVIGISQFYSPQADIFFGDPGLGWHIINGERLGFGPPTAEPIEDPFSITAKSGVWVYGQWLADIIFHSSIILGGFSLFYALGIGICILALLLTSYGRQSSVWRVLLFTPLCCFSMSLQWLARPVIFSFLLFAFVIHIFENSSKKKLGYEFYFVVFLVFLFWSNLHPAFFLGYFLIGLYVLQALLERQSEKVRAYLLALVIGVLASFVNPFSYDLHLAIFELWNSSYFQNLNREWLPPTFGNLAFYPFYLIVVFVFVGMLNSLKSKNQALFVCCLVLAALSFSSRRYIPFFSIAAYPLLLSSWGSQRKRKSILFSRISLFPEEISQTLATGACILIVAILGFIPLNKISEDVAFDLYPTKIIKELSKIKAQTSSLVVLHPPELGGVLTYYAWPNKISLIDDRNLRHDISNYIEIDSFFQAVGNWQDYLKKYKPDFILCRRTAPIVDSLIERGWRVYSIEETNSGMFVLLVNY